ncbi:GNAT family N-acetyltransferase [Dysgonomonas sp. 511]|jgi:GNAT superfamily N-acetyltransferase|uniref:GNAT family N-acetyltransferase n=1 Tax=Dysgonomonas sp. 511 TaxID=2302930 RepID=UPI0013D6D320|nr:GNAT family N-acetyltransferase [Dysgonomonas sp. 511]MDR2947592.1 GNAT family N-acetyltransferase [Prevotella sp.]NDV79811.1 hypothetical protein [Dysgonomonas sp. 511]
MKTIVIDKHFFDSHMKDFFFFMPLIFNALSDLENEYPYFGKWLLQVFDDIPAKKRSIILKLYNEQIIAISIVKHTKQEEKISTFRVFPKYKRLGIGSELMEDSLYYLKNDSPMITVSEKRIFEFSSFLTKLKFEKTQEIPSCYIQDISEHIFNGKLEKEETPKYFYFYE